MNFWDILLILSFSLLGLMYICDTVRKTILGVEQIKIMSKTIDKADRVEINEEN